jgi:ATP-binding cassette subfamily C protein
MFAQALPAFGELVSVIDECERAAETFGEGDRVGRRVGRQLGSHRLALVDRVRLDDVCFAYSRPGDEPAEVIHGVSLELRARTTTALVGPSGAGKTTLADLAVGLLAPTAGVVTIDGEPLDRRRMLRWRDSVAMVPQEPFLFHDTIGANLLWAREDAEEADLWEALAMASAAELVRRLPDGLSTVVGDRGTRLSGGERQRIALARALLRQPELLVLDEATNSLDAGNEGVILDSLARLHGRTTVLVISHQQSAIRDADQIVCVDGGRVADIAWPTVRGTS